MVFTSFSSQASSLNGFYIVGVVVVPIRVCSLEGGAPKGVPKPQENIQVLVVPVTFGHSWLRHSSHLERAVVSIDVVRVSEPTVCTLRLSIRVFTPLLDVRKPKTLVLTF